MILLPPPLYKQYRAFCVGPMKRKSRLAGIIPAQAAFLPQELLSVSRYFPPNTFFRRSVVWAAGLVLIFFSSWPTMAKSPSSALLVT